MSDTSFFLNDELRVSGNSCGELGGESDGLIEGVGVQGLSTTENGSQSFNGGSHDVVVWILLSK